MFRPLIVLGAAALLAGCAGGAVPNAAPPNAAARNIRPQDISCPYTISADSVVVYGVSPDLCERNDPFPPPQPDLSMDWYPSLMANPPVWREKFTPTGPYVNVAEANKTCLDSLPVGASIPNLNTSSPIATIFVVYVVSDGGLVQQPVGLVYATVSGVDWFAPLATYSVGVGWSGLSLSGSLTTAPMVRWNTGLPGAINELNTIFHSLPPFLRNLPATPTVRLGRCAP